MNTNNLIHRACRGLSIATIMALGITVAQAHPGHGVSDVSATHLLTSPDHFLVLATSGVLLVFGARLVQRRLPRRLLQGAGVVTLAGAAVIWSLYA